MAMAPKQPGDHDSYPFFIEWIAGVPPEQAKLVDIAMDAGMEWDEAVKYAAQAAAKSVLAGNPFLDIEPWMEDLGHDPVDVVRINEVVNNYHLIWINANLFPEFDGHINELHLIPMAIYEALVDDGQPLLPQFIANAVVVNPNLPQTMAAMSPVWSNDPDSFNVVLVHPANDFMVHFESGNEAGMARSLSFIQLNTDGIVRQLIPNPNVGNVHEGDLFTEEDLQQQDPGFIHFN